MYMLLFASDIFQTESKIRTLYGSTSTSNKSNSKNCVLYVLDRNNVPKSGDEEADDDDDSDCTVASRDTSWLRIFANDLVAAAKRLLKFWLGIIIATTVIIDDKGDSIIKLSTILQKDQAIRWRRVDISSVFVFNVEKICKLLVVGRHSLPMYVVDKRVATGTC